MRPLELIPTSNDDIFGINLIRYMLSNATWGSDEDFNQYVKGFANLTAFKNAPLFLSNPHFLGAEEKKTRIALCFLFFFLPFWLRQTELDCCLIFLLKLKYWNGSSHRTYQMLQQQQFKFQHQQLQFACLQVGNAHKSFTRNLRHSRKTKHTFTFLLRKKKNLKSVLCRGKRGNCKQFLKHPHPKTYISL